MLPTWERLRTAASGGGLWCSGAASRGRATPAATLSSAPSTKSPWGTARATTTLSCPEASVYPFSCMRMKLQGGFQSAISISCRHTAILPNTQSCCARAGAELRHGNIHTWRRQIGACCRPPKRLHLGHLGGCVLLCLPLAARICICNFSSCGATE